MRSCQFPLTAAWLPSESVARFWMQYVKDTAVTDTTPPPAPTKRRSGGHELRWEAEADLERRLAGFVIECDSQFLAKLPEQGKNPFGHPVFQNLQYSDAPTQPLVPMRFMDTKAHVGKKHPYRVIAVIFHRECDPRFIAPGTQPVELRAGHSAASPLTPPLPPAAWPWP